MQITYANQDFPQIITRSLFLCGPTPRDDETPSWRPEAYRLLEQMGFDGQVFTPEDAPGSWRENYDGQIDWEREGLTNCSEKFG